MAAEFTDTEQFRGARIHLCDLGHTEIRDCEVSGLKIVDCYGSQVYIGGSFGRVVVNDVDVTSYVDAELDRQHPTRVLAREATTLADYRATLDHLQTVWEGTLARAKLLPEASLQERVDDEWSFVETQRHLLFASDAWIGNAVLEEDSPYHPLGLPAGGTTTETTAPLGLTITASPTLNEVLAARRHRSASVRAFLARVSEAELDRICARKPGSSYPDQEYVVRRCLTVVLREEAEHHRYASRDLDALEESPH